MQNPPLTSAAPPKGGTTPPVPGYEEKNKQEIYIETLGEAERLCIYDRLQAFSIAAKQIHIDKKQGTYHLVILNLENKSLSIRTYSQKRLEFANREYVKYEKRISMGENLQVVLVSAGSVANLRHAYPNYFLDTNEFIRQLKRIDKLTKAFQ